MKLDWKILQWTQDKLKCRFLDFAMPRITALGNGGMIWLAASALLICTKKYRKHGFILLGGLTAGLLVGNVLIKNLVARPRPCWIKRNVPLLIANPRDFSFPSCHTLSSVIGASILTMTNPKFGFAAIPAAALIAFSRLYLYVHFPSDILGAVFIGLIIAPVVFKTGGSAAESFSKRRKASLGKGA